MASGLTSQYSGGQSLGGLKNKISPDEPAMPTSAPTLGTSLLGDKTGTGFELGLEKAQPSVRWN